MEKKDKNFNLTIQNEKDSSFNFLNLKICKQKYKLTKVVSRKDKLSG